MYIKRFRPNILQIIELMYNGVTETNLNGIIHMSNSLKSSQLKLKL